MKLIKSLYVQVIIGVMLGIIAGSFFPSLSGIGKVLGEGYIDLIKMLIAPLIFFTITIGIANTGNLKKAGRIGGKALIYFEVVSTFALILGVSLCRLLQPGRGITRQMIPQDADGRFSGGGTKGLSMADFFHHLIPSNIIDSFAKGDILQILIFAVLFGIALGKLGDTGKSIAYTFEKLNKVLFTILNMITRLSPVGAFGGMLYTIGNFGFGILGTLGKLMATFYLTDLIFIFVILGTVLRLYKISIFKLLVYLKEEILIVLGSSSSESVLPNIMLKLERAGCSQTVVGLVIPAGYSFNLDGTSIYLSMAVIFLAQVFQVPLSAWQLMTIVGILIITSKGAGGITGSGFIVLTSSLAAIRIIPLDGLALLIGIDRFMSEARSITNVIGNSVATIVIANSEKQFDRAAFDAATGHPSVTEHPLNHPPASPNHLNEPLQHENAENNT